MNVVDVSLSSAVENVGGFLNVDDRLLVGIDVGE